MAIPSYKQEDPTTEAILYLFFNHFIELRCKKRK